VPGRSFDNLVRGGYECDLAGLREMLTQLHCRVTDKAGTSNGDPLNLVVVGRGIEALFAFIERGWPGVPNDLSFRAWHPCLVLACQRREWPGQARPFEGCVPLALFNLSRKMPLPHGGPG
jgi:hypothetical protein